MDLIPQNLNREMPIKIRHHLPYYGKWELSYTDICRITEHAKSSNLEFYYDFMHFVLIAKSLPEFDDRTYRKSISINYTN